ncbi:MAG: DUF2517 family protein [Aeromonadaceae bacterium]
MKRFSLIHLWFRRACVLVAGIVFFPFICAFPLRRRVYSQLHRIWNKTSAEPVWLTRSAVGYQEIC